MSADTRGAVLLYVEDEAETRNLVEFAITTRYPQLHLVTAENGAAGLDMFRQFRPKVVLTDIKMPKMNGLEMGAEIKAIDPDVHLIAVSAHSDVDYLATASGTGFSDYLFKPIEFKQLFACIDKALSGKELP